MLLFRNQAMFRSEKGRDLVASLPMSRILTETDGPFVEIGDQPVSPGELAPALKLIASAKAADVESIRRRVVANFSELVGGGQTAAVEKS
jgi:TatD DNase family protein